MLDEFGYVPASKVGAELLFAVISTAYERTSLMVTTNLPFESWTEVLGSERLTGATLDRLTHRCQIIETKGESYRLRDARARMTKPKASAGKGRRGACPVTRPVAPAPRIHLRYGLLSLTAPSQISPTLSSAERPVKRPQNGKLVATYDTGRVPKSPKSVPARSGTLV